MAYLNTIQPSSLFSLTTPPMAARKHVSPLSRPTKIIPFQHLQKPTNFNPVHRSLVNLNPNFPNFSSTTAPHSPAKSVSDHRPHWATDYRRRLGIDDARVILQPPFVPWRAPKDGEIKILFDVGKQYEYDNDSVDDGTYTNNEEENDANNEEEQTEDEKPVDKEVVISAVAYNSSTTMLGVAFGWKPYKRGDKLELQMYALKAAANLAKELKSMGMHDGPVVYESYHVQVVRYFADDCDLVGEDGLHEEEFCRDLPGDEDLDDVGPSCPINCGSMDKLRSKFPFCFMGPSDPDERERALSGII